MTKGATSQEPASQASPDFGSYDPFEEPLAPPQETPAQQPAAKPEAAQAAAPPANAAGQAPGKDPVMSEYTEGDPQEEEAAAPAEGGDGSKPKQSRHEAGILAELRSIRDENKELRGALSVILAERQGRAPAKEPEPEPEQVPDPLHDPAGYHKFMQRDSETRVRAVQAQAANDIAMARYNSSEQIARIRHGDDLVDKARQWVISQGPEAGTHFTAQADPMGAAIAAFQRSQVVERVGSDPDAYERQVEDRVIASLRARGVVIPDLPAEQAPAQVPARGQARPTARATNPAAQQRQAPAAPRTATLANQPRGGAAGPQEVVGSFQDFAADFIN